MDPASINNNQQGVIASQAIIKTARAINKVARPTRVIFQVLMWILGPKEVVKIKIKINLVGTTAKIPAIKMSLAELIKCTQINPIKRTPVKVTNFLKTKIFTPNKRKIQTNFQ
ncbi:hypothetical protein TWF281_006356 [Arthrobotrys megalospora]